MVGKKKGADKTGGEHRIVPPGPSWLFAPVDRPELGPKAAARADSVILDLEDGAMDVGDRTAARHVIRSNELDPSRTLVRVVGPSHPGFAGDVQAVQDSHYNWIIVPKLTGAIPRALAGLNIVAMIEHPRALLRIEQIAGHPTVRGLYFGAEDLTIALGGTQSRLCSDEGHAGGGLGPYRDIVRYARSQMVIAAAAAGLFFVDATYADFSDDEGQYREAADAARTGFWATACIHPSQVPVIRRAYAPSGEELLWAEKVVEAESLRPGGVLTVDGHMVDAPLIEQAHRIIARRRDPEGPQ